MVVWLAAWFVKPRAILGQSQYDGSIVCVARLCRRVSVAVASPLPPGLGFGEDSAHMRAIDPWTLNALTACVNFRPSFSQRVAVLNVYLM